MQEGNNYRLGVNYEIIDSLKSYVLYTSTMFVEQDNIDQITKLPIYKLSTPLLEKYDIFNKKINEPDNMYKNQKKSYVSELKRIYKNNIKTRFI